MLAMSGRYPAELADRDRHMPDIPAMLVVAERFFRALADDDDDQARADGLHDDDPFTAADYRTAAACTQAACLIVADQAKAGTIDTYRPREDGNGGALGFKVGDRLVWVLVFRVEGKWRCAPTTPKDPD